MAGECIFCQMDKLSPIASNPLAFAIRDKYPVRRLHTLIVPRRHCENVFETTAEEREAMHELAFEYRASIVAEDTSVAGFNFGSNMGKAAGQKIFHAHLHLIPRREAEDQLPVPKPD